MAETEEPGGDETPELKELRMLLAEWSRGVREWLRANSLAATVHHQAETDRLRRMVGARAAGVDPTLFDVPFPGTQVATNNYFMDASPVQPSPSAPSVPSPMPLGQGGGLSSWARAAILAASLLGAGGAGAGAYGLGQWSASRPQPQGEEWEIRWRLKDGKWETSGGPVKDK